MVILPSLRYNEVVRTDGLAGGNVSKGALPIYGIAPK